PCSVKDKNMNSNRHWIKIVSLSTCGSFLDFFDFSIFALFANFIGQVFFTEDSYLLGLVKSFGVLAVGYLARPLGGFLFGWWGDRQGRKKVFVYSILTMALSTLLIGLLPGRETVGGWAVLFLLIFRFIQGLSFGGELPGAVVFTAEHLSRYRGFGTSFIIASLNYGAAFAAIVGGLLTALLSNSQMLAWGWRIPFFFGFLIGIIGFWVRRSTAETPVFAQLQRENRTKKHPFLHLLKSDIAAFFTGVSLTALGSSVIAFLIFLPTYFSLFLHRPIGNVYFFTTALFLTLALFTPIFGYLSDLVGRRIWLMTSAILVALSSFFLFELKDFWVWLWLLLPLFNAINLGCYEIAIAELFSPNIRYSGTGVCHNLGYGVFGGLGPLIYTLLFQATNDPASPLYFLLFAAAITFTGALFLKNRMTPFSSSPNKS
ncbi:MAG: MFS transporter, partial [Chlamydiales bacterium]